MHRFVSANEAAIFERDGYLVVRGLYAPDEVARIAAWIDELTARPPTLGREMVYFEDSLLEKGKRVLARIENFVDFHDGLRRLVNEERMIGRVGELLGDRALLFREKVNFKMPVGAGFTPHQDIQPGWDDYAPYFISVLVAIDPSTIENGCLELSAGHHQRGMIGRRWQPLEKEELAGIEFVPYPMAPGDVAFFDCFVPH